MRRPLLRVLSVMRWPFAALAVIVAGLALVSSFRRILCSAPVANNTASGIECFAGCVRVHVTYAPDGGLGAAESEYIAWADPPVADGPVFYGWWLWEFNSLTGYMQVQEVFLPAWCIFVPLGALSALGFRAKRRLVIPAGACPSCRHPLAGAAVCPECGTASQA